MYTYQYNLWYIIWSISIWSFMYSNNLIIDFTYTCIMESSMIPEWTARWTSLALNVFASWSKFLYIVSLKTRFHAQFEEKIFASKQRWRQNNFGMLAQVRMRAATRRSEVAVGKPLIEKGKLKFEFLERCAHENEKDKRLIYNQKTQKSNFRSVYTTFNCLALHS